MPPPSKSFSFELSVSQEQEGMERPTKARPEVLVSRLPITKLPPEILADIFEHGNVSASVCLGLTCKLLYAVQRQTFGKVRIWERGEHGVRPRLIAHWMGGEYRYCSQREIFYRPYSTDYGSVRCGGCGSFYEGCVISDQRRAEETQMWIREAVQMGNHLREHSASGHGKFSSGNYYRALSRNTRL
jgi:hypothetical protein